MFLSDRDARYTKNDVESIKGMTPNIAWRSYGDAYTRLYNGKVTPAFVYNFVLTNAVNDNGLTGQAVVCVGIYSERL